MVLYFALRLPNLTLQPIFADEAIYIRWAQVMKAEPTLRFLPLSDGKTPLFMWVMMPLFKIFADPLYAGRFLSVISGFVTLSGAFFLGWKFFNLRAGIWSALLLAVTPFMVFFDRMALVDSMLAAFSVWSLNLALLLIRYPRLDLAMFLGYSLGGGLLTKTPGMFNILAIPFTIVIFNWLGKHRQREFVKILGLWIIAVVIALAMYNALRLGPGFSSLSSRNQDYIFSPLELAGRPLDPFIPHVNDVQEFFLKLIGIVSLVLIVLSTVWIGIKKNRVGLAILFWSLIPLLVEMAFLKTFTARYILFSIPPLLCLGGWMISEIEKRAEVKLKVRGLSHILILGLVLFYPLAFSDTLLNKPALVNIPKNDHKGYFEEWTAGYGLEEIARFLIKEAERGTVAVGTEGYFGTLPDGLQIYLEEYIHRAVKGHEIIVVGSNGLISDDLRKLSLRYPVFFVSNRSRLEPGPERVELIKEYVKDETVSRSQGVIRLFQVLPIWE